MAYGQCHFLDYYFLLSRFLGAVFFHIILHEAGHLVGGLLSGYKFISFRVGSFALVRRDGKFVRKSYRVTALVVPVGNA